MGWDINALLVKLGDLDENTLCPPYRAFSGDTYLKMEVMPTPPTVGLCRRVIAIFELLLSQYGFKEVFFNFGVGSDVSKYKGTLWIGLGRPPVYGGTSSS